MTTTQPKAYRLDQLDGVDHKIADFVLRKLTLKQIVAELAGLGMKVSDMTVLRRIRRQGLSLANTPVARATGAGPWLSAYKKTIVALWDDGLNYAQIWDELARRYPLVTQFARPMSREAKNSTMSVWVHAERHREARPPRGSLLGTLTPATTSRQSRGARETRQPVIMVATSPTAHSSGLGVLASSRSPAAQDSGSLANSHTYEMPTIRIAERHAQVAAQARVEREADAAATSVQQKATAEAVVKRLLAR